MIVGIGSDFVDIRRVEALHRRFGQRLEARLFTQAELAQAEKRGQGKLARLAKYIAAKEAAAKALGTGMGQGIGWRDFEVTYDALGKPMLALHGEAHLNLQRRMKKGDVRHMHLSLSDDYPYALAFVVVEIIGL